MIRSLIPIKNISFCKVLTLWIALIIFVPSLSFSQTFERKVFATAGKETCVGFLQAFNDKNRHVTSVDIIHLYTRICDGNEPRQFYVGYIKDVEVLPKNQRSTSTQHKEQKQKDLKDAEITDFSNVDPMWKKCFNIQFERKNVVFYKNLLENEIQLNRGQFRFSLYDLEDPKHGNILQQINNIT